MTHDILQSDIEMALRLLREGRSEADIAAALELRGIEASKAVEVASRIASGKPVPPTAPHPEPEPQPGEISEADSELFEPPAEGESSLEPIPLESPPNRWMWLLGVLMVIWCGAMVAWFLTGPHYHARTRAILERLETGLRERPGIWKSLDPEDFAWLEQAGVSIAELNARRLDATERERLERLAEKLSRGPRLANLEGANAVPQTTQPAPTKLPETVSVPPRIDPRERTAPSVPFVLTIASNGLELNGIGVTRTNALSALVAALGVPARTNLLSEEHRVVYAFDAHGLLLYSQTDGEEQSLVLDYEATGGTHGAMTAFSGLLAAGGQPVLPGVDANSLVAINTLGLSKSNRDGTILRGRCGDLELAFLFLENPRRLSMAEIVLK
jgi:hypothetical protein